MRQTPGSGPGPLLPADWRTLVILGVLVLLSRLPFLLPGYGNDSDSWLLANAARAMAESGRYQASRLPGYPVQELVSALLWRGGPLALNGATALVSVLATLFFALGLRRAGVRGWGWGAAGLAFTPVVYLNSITAMDYVWALAAGMAALWLVLERRPLAAGIALGLGIGCRLTTGAMLLPLGLLLLTAEGGVKWRSLAAFALPALAVGALCYLPVVATYGTGFFTYYNSGYPPWGDILVRGTVEVWGVPGLLAVVLGALLACGPQKEGTAAPPRGLFLSAGLSMAIYGYAYMRLPYESGYLLPVVPWVLLALAAQLRPHAFQLICAALIFSPFVLYLRTDPKAPDAVAQALRGPLLYEQGRRERWHRNLERLIRRAGEERSPAVVLAGPWLQRVENRVPTRRLGPVEFVYLLSEADLRRRRAEGQRIFYAPYQRTYWLDGRFVELPKVGGEPLLPDLE